MVSPEITRSSTGRVPPVDEDGLKFYKFLSTDVFTIRYNGYFRPLITHSNANISFGGGAEGGGKKVERSKQDL